MPTKRNKSQRLTPPQHAAMRELLSGATVTAAAKAAGVDRATCSQWLNRPGPFRDAYHDARAELWDEMRAALARAGEKSVRVVLEALDGADPDDRLKAALAMLRLLKLDADSIRPKSGHDVREDERIESICGDPDWRKAAALLEDAGWPD